MENSNYIYIPCIFKNAKQYISTSFPATSSLQEAEEHQQEFKKDFDRYYSLDENSVKI